jgi:RHS repeat-associated protein
VSNPISITDERDETERPAGSKPVTRTVPSDGYDDFYRLTKINYAYSNGASNDDAWVSPFDNEDQATSSGDPQSQIDSRRAIPSPHDTFSNRVRSQNFAYDHLGNTTSATDNSYGFYDRSLGTITNGIADAGPHQIKRATITSGSHTGTLTAQYDAAGNMVSLYVDRNSGACVPASSCAQVFKYEYDELNRLQRARRWDMSDVNPDADPLPTVNDGDEAVDLRYRYDADDNRVIKWAHDPVAGHAVDDAYTLYVFDTLDVRRTQFNTAASPNEYELTSQTEAPYLLANGVRLARVVYEENIPASDPANQHVFFELGDHLGSTSTVLDKRTGELVEKGTFQAYGGAESDYRPGRWADFREDYRFTGKEEDVEVGLVYFGKRYLNPLLGRWITPDPLAIYEAGSADSNLYAYVRARSLTSVDALGLADSSQDAVYDYLRSRATPSNGNAVATRGSSYGLNAGTSGAQTVDHIVSVRNLTSRADFASLTLEQQVDILQTPENLAMLDSNRNGAKGSLSAVEYGEKIGLAGDALESVKEIQQRAEGALNEKIRIATEYNRINGVDVAATDGAYLKAKHGTARGGFTNKLAERVFEGVANKVWAKRGESLEAARQRTGAQTKGELTGRVRTRSGVWLRGFDFGMTIIGSWFLKMDKNEHDSIRQHVSPNSVLIYKGQSYIGAEQDGT